MSCALSLPLDAIEASPWLLRRRLAKLSVNEVGMPARTWRTVLANLDAALQMAGLGAIPRRSLIQLSPASDALMQRVVDRYERSKLSRFLRFCDARDIRPEAVDDATMQAFGKSLIDESLVAHAPQVHRDAVLTWNRCVEAVEGWPQVALTVPRYRKNLSVTVDDLPASFGQDMERYLDDRRKGDPLADDGVDPAKPITLRNERSLILQLATLQQEAGVDLADLTNLKALVAVERARKALNGSFSRHEKQPNGQTDNLARCTLRIAKHWARLSEDDVETLRKIDRKVRPPRGVTRKNKLRLGPLRDPQNAVRLLQLPKDLVTTALAMERTRTAAMLVQNALAIAILLVAPMRVKNLAGLNVNGHIARHRAGTPGGVHLVIPGHEVKNDVDLDFPLSPEVAELLDLYLRKFRPLLVKGYSPWLFPNTTGGPKTPAQLSDQIPKAIHGACGLQVNCHLFRHFAALLYLKRHPGDYPTVKLLLGHKSIQTTMVSYCWVERDEAFARYDAMLNTLRHGDSV